MPIPRAIGRLNRVGLNRLTRHLAPHLPGFGLIEHRGRRSGRTYTTPINVFRTDSGYLVALTYGHDTDWLRNLRAAGEGVVVSRGRRVRVTDPHLHRDRAMPGIPPVPRLILRLLGVDEFLTVVAAEDSQT